MKKVLLSLVAALMLLPMAVASMAYADEPTPVSGTRTRVGPFMNVTTQEAGGNTIITRDATQVWSGGTSGTAQVHQTLVQHPNGEFTSQADAICTCTVEGVSGTLYMRILAASDPNGQILEGNWVIVGAEGDLAGLHGQGTFYQVLPGPNVYEGVVHFEP